MEKKNLPLENVSISFDPETASIQIVSNDPRLPENSEVSIQLSKQTESFMGLFHILEQAGLAHADYISIPSESTCITNPEDFSVPGKNPEYSLYVGEGVGSVGKVEINLRKHLLISGVTGSGKTSILRNILAHGLTQPNVHDWIIDFTRVELQGYPLRSNDMFATTVDHAQSLIEAAVSEMNNRYSLLNHHAVHDYLDLPKDAKLPALRIIINDYDLLTRKESQKVADLFNSQLEILARQGRAVGISLVIGTHTGYGMSFELLSNLTSRIFLAGTGSRSHPGVIELLGGAPKYSKAMTRVRGRGILSESGKQTVFQAYTGLFWDLEYTRNPEDKMPASWKSNPSFASSYKSKKVTDLSELTVPGVDPRTKLFIGDNLHEDVDSGVQLDVSSHVSICGTASSGKTTLLNNVIAHALNHHNIYAWVIDPTGVELESKQLIDTSKVGFKERSVQENNLSALNLDEAQKILDATVYEIGERSELLEKHNVDSYLDLSEDASIPAIYVVINDYNRLASDFTYEDQDLLVGRTEEIVESGAAVGVYLIVASHGESFFSESLKNGIGSKITVGARSLPEKFASDSRLFESRGVAVLSEANGEETLFQGYHIPWSTRNDL